MDYAKLFDAMHPGFFESPGIRNLDEGDVFEELVMDLRTKTPVPAPHACPGQFTFGVYGGDIGPLREAVALVDDDWVQYFHARDRVFCAFDGDRIAAFCILSDWGTHGGLRIGGPGCVGTVPAFRRRGIGLEMVRCATVILQESGFDLSWIHFTHVGRWYERLGYRPVLQWNRSGWLDLHAEAD